MLLASLRRKLGSALELMRVYQHKLQSLPIAQGMCPEQRCSTCTAQPLCAPPQPGNTGLQSDYLASVCLHQACRKRQELDPGDILSHEHSLPEQPRTSEHSPYSRLEVHSDPSVEHAGVCLTALQAKSPEAQSQRTSTKSQSGSTGVSAPASANCKRHNGRASTGSPERKTLARDPIPSPGGGVSNAEDAWALMDAAAGGCRLHAVRRFDGDLLSLVTDMEDMMSSS